MSKPLRILLIGATGTLGSVVGSTLRGRGHEVVTVSRRAGDLRADVTDPADVSRVLDEAGSLDAIVSTAGSVPYKTITEMTPEDYLSAYRGKVASQVELVRQGTSRIAPRGSVDLKDVAQAYVRSVEGAETGQIFRLPA